MKRPLAYTLLNFIYKASLPLLCHILLVSQCYLSIIEGVDAEKIQNEDGNQQQRVKVGVLHGRLECVAKCVDGLRRFPCRDRLKAGNLLTIRQFFCNDIVGVFVVSSDSFSAEFK